MSESNEVELKLEIAPADVRLLLAHPALAGVAGETAKLSSAYYDTAGGALRDSGYSLRIRSAGGRFVQTVKAKADGAAGLFDRPEWESDTDGPEIDFEALAETPLGELVKRGKLRKRLAPLFTSEVERRTWRLREGRGEIELVLDEGSIRSDSGEERLSEVEIELKRGAAGDLFALARSLSERVPLRIGVMTKAERGFALAEGRLGRAVKAEPIAVVPEMSVAEAFAAIVHACLRHFRLNERLIQDRRDASALHQARVAMRRLRSAFSLFGTAIADDEYHRLREELRWFTGELGDARNLDVFLKRLKGAEAAIGRSEAKALRKRLEAAREAAYDRVLAALSSPRLRSLMLDLVAWLELGDWRGEGRPGGRPLPGFASDRLDRRWRKVKKAGKAIAALDPEPRHRLRIDIKKLRYAVEFLAGLRTGREARARQEDFVAALAAMQESLGDLNDMETARALVADQAGAGGFDTQRLTRYLSGGGDDARTDGLLADAQSGYSRLVEAGPFWR